MRLLDVAPTLENLFFTGNAVELRSGPGLGKSSVVVQVRDKLEKRIGEPVGLITQMLSTFDAPDVRGYGVPQKIEDELVMRFTKPAFWPGKGAPRFGILFLDEFGQASHDVQKPAADLLLSGRMGDFVLKDCGHWVVWAASNRTSDRSGVVKDLAFIQNRRLLINVTPDVASFVDWSETHGVHPLSVAFAKKHIGTVFSDVIPDKDGPFCTPRSLVKMTEDLLGLATRKGEIPTHSTAGEVASGWIGEGAAAQYMTFAALADELPDIEDILNDPEGATVPKRPDAAFLLSQMLSHHITVDNAEDMLVYIGRMGQDHQVITVKAALRRDPAVMEVPNFATWVQKNTRLIRAAH